MPFTLVREEKETTPETWDDAKLIGAQLLKEGVQLDRVPRVWSQDGAGGWRYVWRSRDEALAAAEGLKRRTGGEWRLREVHETPSIGPWRPLEVDVGRQRDGWVFALEPLTRIAVVQRFPGSCRDRSVFIGTDMADRYLAAPDVFRGLALQLLLILTGLPITDLQVFGEFTVTDRGDGTLLAGPTSISFPSAGVSQVSVE